MLRNTKWVKKELKLTKGEVLDVDQATATRWVALRIAEFPNDGSASIGKNVYSEKEIKDMTMDELYATAKQYGVEVKTGTPKVTIIKKINKHLNPNVPVQENKKPEVVKSESVKSFYNFIDNSMPLPDVEDKKEELDGGING